MLVHYARATKLVLFYNKVQLKIRCSILNFALFLLFTCSKISKIPYIRMRKYDLYMYHSLSNKGKNFQLD